MNNIIYKRIFNFLESKILNWINLNRALPIQLDITNACNLRCNHCYHTHHTNDGSIDLDEWKNIIDQYEYLRKKLKCYAAIYFSGGEPLLSQHLFPLLEYVYNLNSKVKCFILTNGTLLSQKQIEKFKNYKNLSFQVSIDGYDSAEHDKIRGQESFLMAKQGVSLLLENNFPVFLQSVLSKRSENQIEKFFSLAKEWKVSSFNFTRLITVGQAKKLSNSNEDAALGAVELKNAYKKILFLSSKFGIKTSTSLPLMHLLHTSLGRSGRFWEGIVINYQGELLASSRSRIVLGNVLKEGLENLFLHNPLLVAIRKGQIDECRSCLHLRRCGGDRNAAYAESKNYLGKDPGCWMALEGQVC